MHFVADDVEWDTDPSGAFALENPLPLTGETIMTTQSPNAASETKSGDGQAECCCATLRNRIVEHVRHFRELTPNDFVDRSAEVVRKHPGWGIAAGVVAGFFIGRIFRR
jgi:ElaB/YqjD/DUF883 family membrane-anchored ribosome-binding protein